MPVILPFSESFYARTLAASDNDRRTDLARRTVDAAPGRAENWLLLASAYQQKDGVLSDRVLDALRRSYVAGPLSPDAHDWRLAYVFSNWSLMPGDLRRSAMAEAEAYATRYAGFIYIRELAPTLADSDGRMAWAGSPDSRPRHGQRPPCSPLSHPARERSATIMAEY